MATQTSRSMQMAPWGPVQFRCLAWWIISGLVFVNNNCAWGERVLGWGTILISFDNIPFWFISNYSRTRLVAEAAFSPIKRSLQSEHLNWQFQQFDTSKVFFQLKLIFQLHLVVKLVLWLHVTIELLYAFLNTFFHFKVISIQLQLSVL